MDLPLTKQFIRVEKTRHAVKILVRQIEWEGPHTPVPSWITGILLPGEASESDIKKAISEILNTSQYFKTCQECGERKPVGWMHDNKICQGCAERNHGVVH